MREIDSFSSIFVENPEMVKYLNSDGRRDLFLSIVEKYSLLDARKQYERVALLYSLAKSLKVSKPRLVIADILNNKIENVNAAIELCRLKGLIEYDEFDDIVSKHFPKKYAFKFGA